MKFVILAIFAIFVAFHIVRKILVTFTIFAKFADISRPFLTFCLSKCSIPLNCYSCYFCYICYSYSVFSHNKKNSSYFCDFCDISYFFYTFLIAVFLKSFLLKLRKQFASKFLLTRSILDISELILNTASARYSLQVPPHFSRDSPAQ